MIERIENINSTEFQARYVAQRKPCILSTIPDDLQCLTNYQDLEALSRYAGHIEVAVEPISDKGTFGTSATKQHMSFSSFLKRLQEGERLYLTTQYSEDDDEEIVTEPMKTLNSGFNIPVIPKFAGTLVPAKLNLWLGATSTGTSSGLHHDFHDNFYILLSGQKTFRIFPPSWKSCKALQILGRPHEIFSNGLISYGNGMCSDGLKTSYKAHIQADICEANLKKAKLFAVGIEEAEQHYEEAMESLLDAKLRDADEAEDGDFTSDRDPSSSDAEDSTEGDDDRLSGMNEQEQSDLSTLPEFVSQAEEDRELDSGQVSGQSKQSFREDQDPPSFSNFTTIEVAERLKDETLHGIEFDLAAGQMLYLPASYFHEVISTSADHEFHMAINYWFYPPDGLGSTYKDSSIMAELQSRIQKKYPGPILDETERPMLKKVKK